MSPENPGIFRGWVVPDVLLYTAGTHHFEKLRMVYTVCRPSTDCSASQLLLRSERDHPVLLVLYFLQLCETLSFS